MINGLIWRKDAIEALGERPDNWTDAEVEIQEVRDWEMHRAAIMAVPCSAEFGGQMDDLVKRRDILSMLDDINEEVQDGYGFNYEAWREQVMELPSVQSECKKGRWIVKEWHDGSFVQNVLCSECGDDFVSSVELIGLHPVWDYCPNCGAKNGGRYIE